MHSESKRGSYSNFQYDSISWCILRLISNRSRKVLIVEWFKATRAASNIQTTSIHFETRRKLRALTVRLPIPPVFADRSRSGRLLLTNPLNGDGFVCVFAPSKFDQFLLFRQNFSRKSRARASSITCLYWNHQRSLGADKTSLCPLAPLRGHFLSGGQKPENPQKKSDEWHSKCLPISGGDSGLGGWCFTVEHYVFISRSNGNEGRYFKVSPWDTITPTLNTKKWLGFLWIHSGIYLNLKVWFAFCENGVCTTVRSIQILCFAWVLSFFTLFMRLGMNLCFCAVVSTTVKVHNFSS